MIGYDHLGLAAKGYPVKAVINLTPIGSAIGFFDDVFGDPIPNFKRMLASKKFPAYRVQMHYATNHKLIDVDQLTKRVVLYERLAKKYPNVKIYISHTCEYDESNVAAIKQRVDIIKKLAPHCVPVNNKWRGASVKGVLEETHDISKKRGGRFLVSTDGVSMTGKLNADLYRTRFENAEIRFLWASRFNLREEYEKPQEQPPPLEREAVPSPKYIKAIIRLATASGVAPVPTFKGKVQPIKKPLLWKTFAEDKVGEDVRANKPCFISSAVRNTLSIVTKDGVQVATLKYFGNYPPNLKRHYSGTGSNLWGFEIAEKAFKKSGSEFVWIEDGGSSRFFGPLNPAFRTGYFS